MSYTVVMYKLQLYACVCLGGGVWGVSAVVICKLQLYACVCRRGIVYMRACVEGGVSGLTGHMMRKAGGRDRLRGHCVRCFADNEIGC